MDINNRLNDLIYKLESIEKQRMDQFSGEVAPGWLCWTRMKKG
jgi:hypothetical protein